MSELAIPGYLACLVCVRVSPTRDGCRRPSCRRACGLTGLGLFVSVIIGTALCLLLSLRHFACMPPPCDPIVSAHLSSILAFSFPFVFHSLLTVPLPFSLYLPLPLFRIPCKLANVAELSSDMIVADVASSPTSKDAYPMLSVIIVIAPAAVVDGGVQSGNLRMASSLSPMASHVP